MIVGLDHVAFNSSNVPGDIRKLEFVGYRLLFYEEDVPNPKIKRPLMHTWTDMHDLALLQHPSAPPIELIDHRMISESPGMLQPQGTARAMPALYDSFTVRTNDSAASTAFWKTIGFREDGREGLEYAGPVGPSVRLCLEHVAPQPPPHLDDSGYAALAFISTGAEADWSHLKSKGYKVTDIETLFVNGAPKHVFFVQGPSGELVELVGIRS